MNSTVAFILLTIIIVFDIVMAVLIKKKNKKEVYEMRVEKFVNEICDLFKNNDLIGAQAYVQKHAWFYLLHRKKIEKAMTPILENLGLPNE